MMVRDPIQDLRHYGRSLTDSVDPARTRAVVSRAMGPRAVGRSPLPRSVWPRRVAVLAAAAALFLLANVGLALAANRSVPGDPLYPVDRFYERVAQAVGLPVSPALERLEEAAVLVQRGEVPLALETAAEAMKQAGARGLEAAHDALLRAADETRAAGVGGEATAEIKERAAGLLVLAREVVEGAQAGQAPVPQAMRFAEEALRLAEPGAASDARWLSFSLPPIRD